MKAKRVEIGGVEVTLAPTKGRKRDNDVNKPVTRKQPYFAHLSMDKRRELLTFMQGEFPAGVELAFGKVKPVVNMFRCKTLKRPGGFEGPDNFREPDSFTVEVVRALEQISDTVLEGVFTVQNITNLANRKVAETQDMAFNDMLVRTMARGIR